MIIYTSCCNLKTKLAEFEYQVIFSEVMQESRAIQCKFCDGAKIFLRFHKPENMLNALVLQDDLTRFSKSKLVYSLPESLGAVMLSIFEEEPEGFKADIEVSGCYVEIDGNFLMLEKGLKQGEWGVPAGKIEKHETPEGAARRELFEETGIQVDSHLLALGCLYIRKPDLDFVFHLFKIKLEKTPHVCLSEEHLSFRWVPFQHLHDLNLISGAKEAFEYYFHKDRSQTSQELKSPMYPGIIL